MSNGFVCKDNVIDYRSYCCAKGDTTLGCTRDFCSTQSKTLSMISTFCPYQYKVCGRGSSRILLSVLESWDTIYQVSGKFVNTALCYWEIAADPTIFNLNSNDYKVQIKVNYFTYTYIYFNEGSNYTSAVGNYYHKAMNSNLYNFTLNSTNKIYMILIAYADNPTYSISYQLYKEKVVVNETNQTAGNETNVTNTNQTVVVVDEANKEPQYGIYALMACIVLGFMVYIVVEILSSGK